MHINVLKTYAIVMLGGAVGTGFRLFLSALLAARFGETFPIGTLIVNILGCFIIGFYMGLTGPGGVFLATPLSRQFVTIGILGGFTTFSSFSLQTLNLFNDREWIRGCVNIFLSLLLCMAAVWIGSVLASLINQR